MHIYNLYKTCFTPSTCMVKYSRILLPVWHLQNCSAVIWLITCIAGLTLNMARWWICLANRQIWGHSLISGKSKTIGEHVWPVVHPNDNQNHSSPCSNIWKLICGQKSYVWCPFEWFIWLASGLPSWVVKTWFDIFCFSCLISCVHLMANGIS